MSRDLYSSVARLEKEWMNAWCRQEIEKCAQLMSDDFVFVTPRGGLLSKEQWLGAAASYMKCDDFHWEDLRVRPYGRFVVVHGRGTQQVVETADHRSGTIVVTDVWIEREGSWHVNTRHLNGPI